MTLISFWSALVVCGVLIGCGGNSAMDSTSGPKSEVPIDTDATATGDSAAAGGDASIGDAGDRAVVDGGDASIADAAPESGTPGSRVWLDSSVRAVVTLHSFYDTWGTDARAPLSQTKCWAFTRVDLTESQLGAWNALTLVALNPACSVDGYQYEELKVFDADGTSATYRDTGCSYLSVPGATAMLPANALANGIIPEQSTPSCL